MEGMYEYDPETRQYRRKRSPEERAEKPGDSSAADAPTGSPAVSSTKAPTAEGQNAAENNPAYAIREEEDVNYTPPRPPGLTPGKILFWLIFAIIFCGWIYFMVNMYLKDAGRQPAGIEQLIQDQEEFDEILKGEPPVTADEIEVDDVAPNPAIEL
jgi:hypothetical protein